MVSLGCTVDERATPQEVRVSVDLRFPTAGAPVGVQSDDLRDTVCYARICQALREHATGREFQLVEKMAGDFYAVIKTIVERRAEIAVTVHKVNPPIERLAGGVEFRIGDFM